MATLSVDLPSPVSPGREDAIQLFKAFKGFGCDNEAVIGILAHRDATQRACIRQEYNTMYSEDILKRLSSELSGNLKTAVLLWMLDQDTRNATILRDQLNAVFKISFEAVTQIICSQTYSELQTLKQVYHTTFGTHLEHDIELKASGDYQKLLLAYLRKPRYEDMEVDSEMAAKDAKDLYKAGEKKLGTDEKVFVRILSERSRAHLIAVSTCYHDMYGGSLKEAIKKETSGLFKDALLTILRCGENPAKYFAKVLYKSMKGMGTDDITLIRVIVTRTEIDIQNIKSEYHKKYAKSLIEAVHSDTSSHYRTFLLSLLGPKGDPS